MTSMTASGGSTANFNGTNTWGYDSKDRMTSEQYTQTSGTFLNYTDSFAYDSAGNPTTWKGSSQSFNSDNQRSVSGYTFDGNGNPTTYAGSSLTFDPMDKMITATIGVNTHTARYRAGGPRAWTGTNISVPSGTGTPISTGTYYLYDRGNPVIEMNSAGTVLAINVFADDGLVARKASGTWKYYQFDSQGSVSQRSNAAGSVTSSSKYEAYGKHVNFPQNVTDVYAWNGRWGYYLDQPTGLYLCQQRFYDSNQGRWLSRDPIGYRGGVNVYGYCLSRPIGYKDSSGTGPGLDSVTSNPETALWPEILESYVGRGAIGAAIGPCADLSDQDLFDLVDKLIKGVNDGLSQPSDDEIGIGESELGELAPEIRDYDLLSKALDEIEDKELADTDTCFEYVHTLLTMLGDINGATPDQIRLLIENVSSD